MNRKASNQKAPQSPTSTSLPTLRQWLAGGLLLAWGWTALGLASRVHLVMGYSTLPAGPPQLEPFLASTAAWLFVSVIGLAWFVVWYRLSSRIPSATDRGVAYLAAGLLPLSMSLVRSLGWQVPVSYWEALWLSAWTGLSFASLAAGMRAPRMDAQAWRWSRVGVLLITAAVTAWWFAQSHWYYANYMLGFNDFGHFTQRIANTAAGRGLLLETPVLPPFWDHFNPGLLLLVPLWKLFPSVEVIFGLQAISLASGAGLVWALAKRLGYPPGAAWSMSAAWIAQPALGQMNLAYSYGWHPISLAIPLLLAALWCLVAARSAAALACAVVAMSMEEGVIVVVSLFCGVCAAQAWWERRGWWIRPGGVPGEVWGLSVKGWSVACLLTAVAFWLVYRWSGIAEFQTGRFVALGDTAGQVLLSPVLRPSAFWGQIFRWDKAAFLMSLALPCSLLGLVRGWRWLLPTALPLLVLIAWDHKPATSLAFQYPSGLLPLFWFAALCGGRDAPRATACGALTTGLVLSLFVGQLPYSTSTLLDVEARTYGESIELRRTTDAADGRWLDEQVATIQQSGEAVLATGRIAAHFVGNEDIETVGQYLQRRQQLSNLTSQNTSPLLRYTWIVLDEREGFQQTTADVEEVANEAERAGFAIAAQAFDIVVWKSPQP